MLTCHGILALCNPRVKKRSYRNSISFDKYLYLMLWLHCSGCLIAELQVLGVKANYMKRPYDSTTSFAVHGVHLVDAIQSFGPDYELLFSSCKPHLSKSSNDTNFSPSRSKLQGRIEKTVILFLSKPSYHALECIIPMISKNIDTSRYIKEASPCDKSLQQITRGD